MKCDHCNRQLIKISRRNEMTELSADVTDGQFSDYLAAEESGNHGAWNLGIVEYFCRGCKRTFQLISDELKDYRPLIINWHQKAMEGDYFSRFVFEYLAFIAYLKNILFIAASKDRVAIQNLKQYEDIKEAYLKLVNDNRVLNVLWINVIAELTRYPLTNTSHDMDNPEIDSWWNENGEQKNNKDQSLNGTVLSTEDWGNMVEFWYAVRNNLFHGGKDPSIKRDLFLVEHAYKTLEVFMENEVNKFYVLRSSKF